MKDSKEKEHRISNLKDMINNIKDDEIDSYDDIEEDSELIEYLNKDPVDYDGLEINDDFIYHPGDENEHAIDLEENQIDEDFIIKTPNVEESKDEEETNEFNEDIVGEISHNFDAVLNAKIAGRPILAIAGTIIGIILIIISIFIFESRSDRVVDNVVAGESSFMFIIFLAVGALLLVYGIYKLFNIKNPFESMAKDIDSVEDYTDDKKDLPKTKNEKPSPKVIPKSEIPLDKDSYKVGEFDLDELKKSLKKPTDSKNKVKFQENIDDIPPAKEKSPKKKEPAGEEVEENDEFDYIEVQHEEESIDDIFAEVEEIDELPIISIDSKEEKE
jgi:hypothetical protein